MKKRIALVYGGASKEHDVSVKGYGYMRTLLSDTEYEILPVYIGIDGEWSIRIKGKDIPAYPTRKEGGSIYTGYGFIKIDAAIPLLHGVGGEDGTIQGALEVAGIPYVGATVCASAVCLDKALTKTVARSLGIPTLDDAVFSKKTDTEEALGLCREKVGFPMFIKPRQLGSSVGAFPLRTEEDFRLHFDEAMSLGDNLVIVERMLDNKRELECAFIEMDGQRIITPPGEILVDGFYGWGEKYGGETRVAPRAEIDSETAWKIQGYAELLADALTLRHLARIDFFLADGEIYFNEINTFPGFTAESLYPKMLEANGIDPRSAILSFIEDTLGGRTL
ncbi:MAG: D-alanine--D-alanine ligase [Clostridia bacterium]|nr:D-alanine--D-alanine ligase [Clostridia bacterium]